MSGQVPGGNNGVSATNHATGHRAEQIAAKYLQSQGYKVYEINWRHRRAEIDIVAGAPSDDTSNGGAPVFVEVKYRASTNQGGGLDYITPRKLQQMRFAAELWTAQHGYSGTYTLAAMELAGADYAVTAFLPDIS